MIRNHSSVGSRVIGGGGGVGWGMDIISRGVKAWPEVMYVARALKMELR